MDIGDAHRGPHEPRRIHDDHEDDVPRHDHRPQRHVHLWPGSGYGRAGGCPRGAAALRRELRAAYPDVRLSVRLIPRTASVCVAWDEDSPATVDVRRITDLYETVVRPYTPDGHPKPSGIDMVLCRRSNGTVR